jgi:hypothetical protein
MQLAAGAPMTLPRHEWLPAFTSMVGGTPPTVEQTAQLLDLATVLSSATDPLTVAISFWIVGSCNGDLDQAIRTATMIVAWDDSEDQV